MKLISLNIWGGHVYGPLLEFIRARQDVDIFCFQEVYHKAPDRVSTDDKKVALNIFSELQELLPGHNAFFRPTVRDSYGIGTFVRKEVAVLQEGDINIHTCENYSGRGPSHSRNLQWLQCCVGDQHFWVLNVHGLWNGLGKKDSPDRIAQSKKIRAFLDQIDRPKILCGDLNLRPDTESIKIIEHQMYNLVKLHKVNSTRTRLYTKAERFADYIFTSNKVQVNAFKVLEDEVSDHSPLFLDFALRDFK